MKWLKPFTLGRTILSRVWLPLVVTVLSVVLRVALPTIPMLDSYRNPIYHLLDFLTIGSVYVALHFTAQVFRDVIYKMYDIAAADNIRERRARTQIDFIYRLILIALFVIGLAIFLMTFESARKFGTSLIASAGLLGAIIGFAAQRSISNLIAGFQVAFTQPIRIDDVVVVEKEWGRIEEITLTYVAVKLWDLRRLVLPLSYFIEKPFENWTRTSADILTHFFLYADYEVSVEQIREQLKRAASLSPLWDQKVCLLQVTNFREHCVELRILVSARNASDAFDLACFLRERLLKELLPRLAHAVPKARVVLQEAGPEKQSPGLDSPANG